jgi:hypothetical protein
VASAVAGVGPGDKRPLEILAAAYLSRDASFRNARVLGLRISRRQLSRGRLPRGPGARGPVGCYRHDRPCRGIAGVRRGIQTGSPTRHPGEEVAGTKPKPRKPETGLRLQMLMFAALS